MKDSHIKVLLIEDNPGDVRLIQEMLAEKSNASFELVTAECLKAGLKQLAKEDIDIVLLDLGLPDSQGLDTLIKVRDQGTEAPIVVLTGLYDEKTGLEAVEKGAQDYLIKGQVDGNLLIRAMRYAMERKRAEDQIKASLREKEVLLREVHHRVKNNMQIISSLFNLQSGRVKDKQARELFKSSQSRVRSLALIHERLYESKDFSKVNFAEYVQSLIGHLSSLYEIDPKNIKLNIDIKDVLLDINTAIPCGLIVNELVSNSLRHGFQDCKKGEINIAIHTLNENEVELVVSDSGVGLPKDINLKNVESLGLHLVTMLAKDQLHGDVKLDRTKGTSFQIKFEVKQ